MLQIVGAKIGKNFKILGSCRFDFPWRLSIGNNCFINSTYFDCRGSEIVLKDNVDISENTTIYTLYHNINSRKFETKFKKVLIESKVWIASNCIVLPGSIIRNGCVVSTNSVVDGELEAYNLYKGNYAVKVRSLPRDRAEDVRL